MTIISNADAAKARQYRFTLPQPSLVAIEMPWVVVAGSLGFRNAFATEWHAVAFALDLAKMGTPVSLGHAAYGWFGLFDDRLAMDSALVQVRAWADTFGEA